MDILALNVTVCGPMGVVGSGQNGWVGNQVELGYPVQGSLYNNNS